MDALLIALSALFEPFRLLMLCAGVGFGLVIGVIPGLGGVFGLTILIPLTYALDPYAAMALLLGMASVTTTSDTIPAILIGVPGTVGAAATCLDGHELAKQKQSARALGAAYTAQLIGGIFGALVLALSIPVMRPLVTALSFGDLLAITIFGLTLVALLSGGNPLKGIIAALMGVLLSYVGLDPQLGEERWTFGLLYLWDGVPTEIVFLGLFGLTELASLMQRGQVQYTPDPPEKGGMWRGMVETLQNWPLVLRGSALGAILGAVPGIGLSAIDWIAYGDAARRTKGGVPFGQGNIRAVIAPESASNAKEGGALIPTLAFGIPGSATMSLLLGAFAIQGLTPGPQMLTQQMPLLITMILTIALANIIGTIVCLGLTGQLARLATVPARTLVPIALVFVVVGAFHTTKDPIDLVLLLGFGALGLTMKRLGWPRPAFVLGFVLGPNLERFFGLSYQISGWSWLGQPVVMILLAMGAAVLLRHAKGWRKARLTVTDQTTSGPDLIFAAGLGLLAAACLWAGRNLPPAAILFPAIAASAAVILTLALLVKSARLRRQPLPAPTEAAFVAWIAALCLLVLLAGHLIGPALFLALWWGRHQGGPSLRVLAFVLLPSAVLYLLFDVLIYQGWPDPWLGGWAAVILR